MTYEALVEHVRRHGTRVDDIAQRSADAVQHANLDFPRDWYAIDLPAQLISLVPDRRVRTPADFGRLFGVYWRRETARMHALLQRMEDAGGLEPYLRARAPVCAATPEYHGKLQLIDGWHRTTLWVKARGIDTPMPMLVSIER